MFEALFSRNHTIARHRNGPLAGERERYLCHCATQGCTLLTITDKASRLLAIARRMSPCDYGCVDAQRLHTLVKSTAEAPIAPWTATTLLVCARPWFKFLGWWSEPKKPTAFNENLDRFVTWMRDERGLTPCTVEQWRDRAAQFLNWCHDTDRDLADLTPQDIDAYFLTYGAQRWSRLSTRHIAQALRVFLRHAADTGACDAGLADSMQIPRCYALESLPYALDWEDVQRVIASADTDSERDIRDRAILLLLAVYGLRRGEVAALRLDQIDRRARKLHIWRLKRNQPQVYPLTPAVLQALDRYIDNVRPQVACPEVFINLRAPRSSMATTSIYYVVSQRLRALGLQAAHLGPHALRHSCAAKLIAEGLTLKEVGDHLGHRSTLATQPYMKVDMAGLRQVGDFDLGSLR